MNASTITHPAVPCRVVRVGPLQPATCPVCGITFSTKRNREQTACSLRCAGILRTRSSLERFEEKFERTTDGCWEWQAQRNKHGYGKFYGRHPGALAHRFSYLTYVGEIPPGMYVCHRCDNPACVRPDHLFLGTHLDNVRDMDAKGRRRNATARPALRGEGNGFAKLTERKVVELRVAYAAGAGSFQKLADHHGVSFSTARDAIVGRTWGYVAEPRPIRHATEPRTFNCIDQFDACLEAGMCMFPGRCSQNRGVAA